MKKRILLLTILALILSACLVLYSCDKENDDQKEDDNQEETVTVTFDTKGGSKVESVQVEVGKKATQPQDPQKEGYTFDGWYLGDEKWSFVGYTVTESITLTAKWVPITYTITYVGNATNIGKKTYTVEDEIFILDGIANERYYEFLGWYEDEEFTKPISKIEKGTVGDKTLYAKIEYNPLLFKLIVGGYAVAGCDSNVTSIVIPSTYKGKSVTSIGEGAFKGCIGLTSIEIPNSVTSIDKGAFEGCTSLKFNEYDNGLYLWNNENPYLVLIKVKNESIKTCEINKNTKIIGGSAFSGCTGLTSIEIPNSVTSIGEYAFLGCAGLTSIKIPNSVTSIGMEAFFNCTGLTSVKMENGVTSIGERAFFNCIGLTSIIIPNSLTSMGSSVFEGCKRLTIYCEAQSQPSDWAKHWNMVDMWENEFGPVVWGYKQGE